MKAASGWAAFALLCLTVSGQATVLINDTFSDGDRLTQDLPDSAHWFTGGPAGNSSIVNGALTFADASAGKATTMAYFNAVDLQVGQSLSLSFDYSFSKVANSDNSFLFGLYNSGGSYQTKDVVGFNNSIFNDYTGYATSGVFGPDPSGPGRDHIEARDKTGHNLLSIGTYTEGAEHIQNGGATPDQFHTASMKIERLADGVAVTSKVGDTAMTQTYTASMFTRFDTAGIFSNGDTGTLKLDNIHLEYAGAPEASTAFGMAVLGMLVFGKLLVRKGKSLLLRSI